MIAFMSANVVWLKVDGEHVAKALQEAHDKLDAAQEEIVLDFSSVRRLDAAALRAMESLAKAASGGATKVVLRGVVVDIYKVLKLTGLASRFSCRT